MKSRIFPASPNLWATVLSALEPSGGGELYVEEEPALIVAWEVRPGYGTVPIFASNTHNRGFDDGYDDAPHPRLVLLHSPDGKWSDPRGDFLEMSPTNMSDMTLDEIRTAYLERARAVELNMQLQWDEAEARRPRMRAWLRPQNTLKEEG